MNKQEFIKLNIQDQVQLINNELKDNKTISVAKLCKELGLTKSTIIDRFIKSNYKFDANQRQYIKNDPICSEYEYKNNIDVFKNTDSKNKLNYLLNNYDNLVNMLEISNDIQEMMKWYDKQKDIIKPVELKIDNNKLIGEVKTTTVRLYSQVWNDFREFTEGYKEYKRQDLVSTALIEFMNKYK